MYNLSVYSTFGLDVAFQVPKKCELYVDMLPQEPKNCFRILWMMEPPEIVNISNSVIDKKNEFDLILTWHENVLDNCSNAKLFPHGTCWISDFDINVRKEFSVTSLVGGKTFTKNQYIRQKLPLILPQITSIPVILFNSANNPYQGTPKIERNMSPGWIKNELFYSQFHIAIENTCHKNYFSEKLIDCFQTKTVPIYLGCPNIGDFFDTRGMILVDSEEDIVTACESITESTYSDMLEFINKNYELSMNYHDFRKRIQDEILSFIEKN